MLFQRALISFRLLGGKLFLEIYVRLIATTIQIPTYPDATGLPPLPTHCVHILLAYIPGKSPQSCLTLCNLMDCRLQAPLSMGFSRQEYWSGLWFPFPGDLPNLAITPGSHVSCSGRLVLYIAPPGKASYSHLQLPISNTYCFIMCLLSLSPNDVAISMRTRFLSLFYYVPEPQ